MVDKDFWRPDDALLVQYWLEDLIDMGYQPPIQALGDKQQKVCDSPIVKFTPKEQPSSYLGLGKTNKNIF